jgi:hypothetical protein
MRRKVVLQGGVALTIALPIKWAKKNNVSKGDEIEILEENNRLEILPSNGNKGRVSRSTKLQFVKETFSEILTSYYEDGYDEVIVSFKSFKDVREIESAVNDLMGLTIVSQDESKCYIKYINEVSEEEFRNIFRRNFLVFIQISQNLLNFSLAPKNEFKEELSSLGDINRRLTFFLKRFLIQRTNFSNSIYLYSFVKDVRRMADEYSLLITMIDRSKEKINDNAIELLTQMNSKLKDFNKNFFSSDKEDLEVFTNIKRSIHKTLYDISKSEVGLIYNLAKTELITL